MSPFCSLDSSAKAHNSRRIIRDASFGGFYLIHLNVIKGYVTLLLCLVKTEGHRTFLEDELHESNLSDFVITHRSSQ